MHRLQKVKKLKNIVKYDAEWRTSKSASLVKATCDNFQSMSSEVNSSVIDKIAEKM